MVWSWYLPCAKTLRAKASPAGEAPGVEPVAPPTLGEPFPVTPMGMALGRLEWLGPGSTALGL